MTLFRAHAHDGPGVRGAERDAPVAHGSGWVRVRHRRHPSSFVFKREEHDPGRGGRDLRGARGDRFGRHVGAAEDAADDLAVVHERERDGVLPLVDEPLGSVDGVQDPVLSCSGRVGFSTDVDGVGDLFVEHEPDHLVGLRVAVLLIRGHEEDLVDQRRHAVEQRRVFVAAEIVRALLGDHLDVWM